MKTLTVKPIFNRKNKLNDRGKAVIQFRFTYNRKSIYSNTGIYIEPRQFDSQRLRVKFHDQKFELNKFLQDTETKALAYFYRCKNENKDFSLSNLIDHLEGRNSDFISFFENAIKSYSSAKKNTVKTYISSLNLLRSYRDKIPFSELNYDFVLNFYEHLKKTERKDRYGNTIKGKLLSESYIQGVLKHVSIFTRDAIKKDLANKNPFDRLNLKKPKTKKVFLEMSELKLIEEVRKVPNVKDFVIESFLFQVYTGLRFSDLKQLKVRHIKSNWLEMETMKREVVVKIPMHLLFDGKALAILEKNVRFKTGEALVFKTLDLSSNNDNLKKLAKYLRINKNLTSHVGRNTCAKLLRNHYQLPLDMIKQILGHSDLQVTEDYAQISKDGIEKAIQEVIKKTG